MRMNDATAIHTRKARSHAKVGLRRRARARRNSTARARIARIHLRRLSTLHMHIPAGRMFFILVVSARASGASGEYRFGCLCAARRPRRLTRCPSRSRAAAAAGRRERLTPAEPIQAPPAELAFTRAPFSLPQLDWLAFRPRVYTFLPTAAHSSLRQTPRALHRPTGSFFRELR
jgi:hypothetical protein